MNLLPFFNRNKKIDMNSSLFSVTDSGREYITNNLTSDYSKILELLDSQGSMRVSQLVKLTRMSNERIERNLLRLLVSGYIELSNHVKNNKGDS